MTKLSGFTFVHDALNGGYPIVEAIRAVQPYVDEMVIVDCASTDGTRDLLEEMAAQPVYDVNREKIVPLIILNGEWGNQAGETLRQAHSKYIECSGDVIVHFEADEVYDDSLIRKIRSHAKISEDCHLAVMRLQLEQNFQRCRWYPESVHRVFPRLANVRKDGHTTDQHSKAFQLEGKSGYLWDITNCFRDNWFGRVEQQAKLRGANPQYVFTPIHTLHKSEYSGDEARQIIYGSREWTRTSTPFRIPEILRPLVGATKYEPTTK